MMSSRAHVFLILGLAVGGCVMGEPGDEEKALGGDDEEATSTAEQGLTQTLVDTQNFGGNLFPQDIPFATNSTCHAGFVRSGATPTTTWSSALGGYCMFAGWVDPGNVADCRARMIAHTPGGWSGGTCVTYTTESVPDAYTYGASSTNSAQINTVNRSIVLGAGQTLTIGTCGIPGASFTGDTFLRLNGPGGGQFAQSDDACSGLGSKIVLTAPVSGYYEIHAGCFANNACSGTVAWTVQ